MKSKVKPVYDTGFKFYRHFEYCAMLCLINIVMYEKEKRQEKYCRI